MVAVGLAHGGVQHITGSSIAACHWLRQPGSSHCPAEIQGPSWVGAAGSMAQAGNDALWRLFLTLYPGVVRIGQPHEPASVTSPQQSQTLLRTSNVTIWISGYLQPLGVGIVDTQVFDDRQRISLFHSVGNGFGSEFQCTFFTLYTVLYNLFLMISSSPTFIACYPLPFHSSLLFFLDAT